MEPRSRTCHPLSEPHRTCRSESPRTRPCKAALPWRRTPPPELSGRLPIRQMTIRSSLLLAYWCRRLPATPSGRVPGARYLPLPSRHLLPRDRRMVDRRMVDRRTVTAQPPPRLQPAPPRFTSPTPRTELSSRLPSPPADLPTTQLQRAFPSM